MTQVVVREPLNSLLSILLTFLIALPGWAAPPQEEIDQLVVEIIQGDNATYNPRELTTQEFIVEVRDDNDRPVAGAMVVFFLPESGPGGQFPGGAKSLSVTTDQAGRATAKGFVHGTETGKFQIRVEASYQGATGQAVMNQAVVLPSAPVIQPKPAGGGFNALLAVGLAAAAGAAVAVAVAVGGGNGGGTPSGPVTPVTQTTITAGPGAPTVGAP